jgi:hypothetical protein
MPQESQGVTAWPAPLAGRVTRDARITDVAAAIAAVWREIDAALRPIIGQRGVAALYQRSLKLGSTAHPWLAAAQRDLLDAIDPAALQAVLLKRTPAEAATAGCAMFQAFHDLLSSLIGVPLTERLLHAVWADPTTEPPSQDLPS